MADLPATAELRVIEGMRHVRVDGHRIIATILPGRAVLEARTGRKRSAPITLDTAPVYSDRAGDGMPDFLRLDDPGDIEAFRHSFTRIAEAAYFRSAAELPGEITDCSSLIRYAYRETFRESARRRPSRYTIPHTPLGPRVFRVRPGPFQPSDINGTVFAEFADADSLRRWNTFFVSRDVRNAQQGDLLFYRQLEQRSPFHAMVFAGRSHFDSASELHLVYHTGPVGKDKGEVRRPSMEEMLRHPIPQWRPVAGNGNFLGVYRWNILRQDS